MIIIRHSDYFPCFQKKNGSGVEQIFAARLVEEARQAVQHEAPKVYREEEPEEAGEAEEAGGAGEAEELTPAHPNHPSQVHSHSANSNIRHRCVSISSAHGASSQCGISAAI